MDSSSPQETFVITDLETLRTLSDPLRMQIYEILIAEAGSVRLVAERLGLAASRLYYHFNQLEKFGLIRVVETRMVANMVEKIFRSAAYKIDVAPDLLNFSQEESRSAVTEIITSHLDTTREDLLRSLQARMFELDHGGASEKRRNVMVNRVTANIPDTYAEEFNQRLQALMQEFSDRDVPLEEGGEDHHSFALMIAFYPTFYYKDGES